MSYVYTHKRLDNNEIFYVGIGSDNQKFRAYDKNNRNKFWKNIVSKTDYLVEIVFDNLTRNEAADIERILIEKYGRRINSTGTLCNISSGGEYGAKGSKRTNETKDKIRKKNVGKKLSVETIQKIKDNSGNWVICLDTLKIFPSITQAAEYLNINKSTLYNKLMRDNINDTSMIMYSQYLYELEQIEKNIKNNFEL